MNKATWKRRSLGVDRIREVLRTSKSLAAAARELGVDRSTLHRWLDGDASLKSAARERLEAGEAVARAAGLLAPDDWVRAIEAAYALTETERVLLDLARQALELARDLVARPAERVAAMGRFQRLVEQLRLDEPVSAEEPAKEPARPPEKKTDRIADPRSVLMAVK